MSAVRKSSYLALAGALFLVARCDLGHALIAGLFAHMLLNHARSAMRGAGASESVSRWAALGFFLLIGVLLAVIFASFIQIGLVRLPILLDRMLPRLDVLTNRFGVDLPVDNVAELRELILQAMKDNARSIGSTSGLLTRGFFQIAFAIVVAVLQFLTPKSTRTAAKGGLEAEFAREITDRVTFFASSFERVMGAQIVVAAINAALAAVFLIAMRFPFRTLLTLTSFVCGLVPIAGNIASNALIVAAALGRSDRLALIALVYMVVVHKLGYFLNGRIIGARTETPTWAILLGLLVGEALMGVTGVLLAPTLIHYARAELRAIPVR